MLTVQLQRKDLQSGRLVKLRLSQFLSQDCGFQAQMSVQEIMRVLVGNYVLYEHDREMQLWELWNQNVLFSLNKDGLRRIELHFGHTSTTEPIDWEGFNPLANESEAAFLDWCKTKNLTSKEIFRHENQDGATYQLQFPSGADVLISNGEIHRVARDYE